LQIFASDDFLTLTEYSREEILGRNCRFLQGPETDQKTVDEIRAAIKEERDVTVQLLNYKKSGVPFWNMFHLQPVRDKRVRSQNPPKISSLPLSCIVWRQWVAGISTISVDLSDQEFA
jgi:PAS domain-containing protein